MRSEVTIIMSLYKVTPDQLKRSLDSIFAQEYSNWLLDVSIDGRDDVIADLIASNYTDSRVSVYHYYDNSGLTERLVEAVARAETTYIARIDAGDVWFVDKLRRQINFLEKNPDVVLVGAQVEYFLDDGTFKGISNFSCAHESICARFLVGDGVFEHSSIVFRNIVNYRKRYKYSQDLDLYARSINIGKLACLPLPLVKCFVNFVGLTLQRKPDQLYFISLCYSDFLRGHTIDAPAPVRQAQWVDFLWPVARIFYKNFLFTQLFGVRYLNLFIASVFYPPLGLHYVRRLSRKLRWRV